MQCSKCGTEGIPGKKFCAECGSPLSNRCSNCGSDNAPGAKFCADCGNALGKAIALVEANPGSSVAQAPSTVRIATEQPDSSPPDGERKTVTALFADIKGSMELMEDLDPEEARAIVDPALKLMIDAVRRYDGYIVQSTGDGIFALFGAPVAHEDHPQRALYAALRMQDELRRYSAKMREAGNQPVEARVGVNTGEVVVRSLTTGAGQSEYTPIGLSIGLASRMQTVAPTGSIAATQQVRKLCEGYFLFKGLGATRVKGVAEPVQVYEVTGLGSLRTRLQVAATRGLSKFVGREAELAQMRRAMELVRQGHGQILAAMGEPGVGKSRLFFEFKAIEQSGCAVLEAYSASHGKASAYLPVLDLLRSYFKITPEDDDRARREKIAGRIVMLDRALEDTLPYLFGLLGIVEGDDPLAQLEPQLRRRRILEAIKRILARESRSQPLILIIEDLHWIDSETQTLVDLLADAIATARVLLLVNYRPEYHHQWGNKTYYTQLRLDPLGKDSADEMLSALLTSPAAAGANRERACPETPLAEGSLADPHVDDLIPTSPAAAGLPAGANRERPLADVHVGERVRAQDSIDALKHLIIERTQGNPFFMEEMVQTLFEQGVLTRNGAVKLAKPVDQIRIPATVQAILASRIDRLPAAEKELLQTLAVLGREFSLGLIKRVSGTPDGKLELMLSDLQAGEFIYEQPATGDVEYQFKHALTREVAYYSVLAERRRFLHERAAQAIEALFADRLDDHLAELARHYDRSGNVAMAVQYLGQAGHRAARQVAHSEAVGYLNRALELLQRLPEHADRHRRELNLQMALAWSLFVLNPTAPEREPTLIRAQQLSEQLGDIRQLMQVLLQLGLFRLARCEYGTARELAQRVLAVAESTAVQPTVAGAHFLLGLVFFYIGEPQASREHLELAGAQFKGGSLRDIAEAQYAEGTAAALPMTLLMLGYPSAALRMSGELVAAMRQLSNPISIQRTLLREAMLRRLLRDSRTTLKQTEEALSIASDQGMTLGASFAVFSRGRALADEGRGQEGIAEMSRAISALEENAVVTIYYSELADSLGKNGRTEEGLAAVAKGLSEAKRRGENFSLAPLYAVNGELLLMRDPPDEAGAERCFRTAIDIARLQKARFFELRATASLARLLKQQGKPDEARAMLADIYNWFTEGFEFADLKEARALLDELGA